MEPSAGTPFSPQSTIVTPRTPNKVAPLITLVVILFVLMGGGLLYLGYQNNQLKKVLPESQQAAPSAATDSTVQWRMAKHGGAFNYEYPNGWHVAELWSSTVDQGIVIAMDPEPISTAPRGGPISTFEISVLSGLEKPNEEFDKRKSAFNEDNYTDITSETIEGNLGTIYHYKGKIKGEMFKGETVETYYFTFETGQNDPLNQQIIIATTMSKDDENLSGILRHVVLSINRPQQETTPGN